MSYKINCIVLHRIVKTNIDTFEDIKLLDFEYLVNSIKQKTIVANETQEDFLFKH